MLEQKRNDNYILEMYKKIEIYENDHYAPAYHSKVHAFNVTKLIKEILSLTTSNLQLIENAEIAGLLHDLGCYKGKEDHEKRSYEIAKKYLEENRIILKYHNEVLQAIRNHRNDFCSNNLILRALVLSDKLDITKERISKFGMDIIGMRQLQHIYDVVVDLQNDIFIVNFLTDENIDINELLEKYSFMKKVFLSIKAYANFINLDYMIKINNKCLEEYYEKGFRGKLLEKAIKNI